MESIKKRRGRPTKQIRDRPARIIYKKCPMCEDLNKIRKLNKDKIVTTINLKPVIVSLMN
jgi:hypothetical protein